MSSLISYFAQRSFLARIITIMVLLLGIASLYTLKLQEYPDVAFETVEIETLYPGATAQDIDLAMRFGTNYPKGLLAWCDELGANKILTILENLYNTYCEDRYRPSSLLRKMAKENSTFF